MHLHPAIGAAYLRAKLVLVRPRCVRHKHALSYIDVNLRMFGCATGAAADVKASDESCTSVTTATTSFGPQPLVGRAFCWLPLPVETGLPIHVNGYFELSSNRRDIWQGDDMAGEGQLRSQWNTLLLQDVVASLYGEMLQV